MKPLLCGAAAALVMPAMSAGVAGADDCGPMPAEPPAAYSQTTPLTLEDAIARAGATAPEVLAAALEARAVAADADQAGRWLNPAVSLETENFAGSGALEGFEAFETTLAVEQTFRLGDKRRLAERAGRAEAALASAQCRVQRLEAATLGGERFLDLKAAIDMADLASASAELAGALADVVERRVDAGAAAPPELARARADAAVLEAAAEAARGEVQARALSLAALWGAAEVDFILPAGDGTGLTPPETPGASPTRAHPRLDAADRAAGARAAAAELARVGAYPDVTLSAGIRRFEDTGDTAFLAGLSVALPVFDRNRDATRAAELRRAGARLSARAVDSRLRARQSSLAARLRAAAARLARLEDEALPLAEQAYAAAAEGYRVGKFDLTATLDARRSLIETRAAIVEARLALETETLRLRALIGAPPFAGDTQ